jgi:ketosteroid isomerase-like protein
MSEEAVQLARQMIEAWNKGEVDQWASDLDDDVVWVPLAENPQTEPVQGREATREFVLDWVQPWDEYKIEIIRIVDAGDRVVILGHHEARHESGAEISMDMHVVATVRDGKGREFRWFTDEAEALAAAGIEDDPNE